MTEDAHFLQLGYFYAGLVHLDEPGFWSRIREYPSKDIGDGAGDVFFRRYTIFEEPHRSLYLHEFLRSDASRCLHDHPWAFRTLIIRGGYIEVTKEGRFWRKPGYFASYPAEHAHKIMVHPHAPLPLSVVMVAAKTRSWGFWTPDGWVARVDGVKNPICE